MDCKVGDIVHVRTKVKNRAGDRAFIFGLPDSGSTWFDIIDIVHVEPRALKVGDAVKLSEGTGQILAIDDNVAWVRYPHGSNYTVLLTDLTRT